MGWYYLPVVLLTSTLALVVALLLNNIQRRYPVFWFGPAVSIPAPVDPDLGGPETDSVEGESDQGTANERSAENLSPKRELSSIV